MKRRKNNRKITRKEERKKKTTVKGPDTPSFLSRKETPQYAKSRRQERLHITWMNHFRPLDNIAQIHWRKIEMLCVEEKRKRESQSSPSPPIRHAVKANKEPFSQRQFPIKKKIKRRKARNNQGKKKGKEVHSCNAGSCRCARHETALFSEETHHLVNPTFCNPPRSETLALPKRDITQRRRANFVDIVDNIRRGSFREVAL